VPTEAIPLDGATKAYMRAGAVPCVDPEIVEDLKSTLERRGAKFHLGTICSSDTFYLEEEADAKKWAAKGVLSFEMECSVTFAVGNLRGYRAGAILVVSGKIFGDRERILDNERTQGSMSTSIESALDVVTSVRIN
jgi:purine-nucleoside phosphorylase